MTIKLRGFIDNVFDVQGGNHWSADPKAIHALSNSFALKYDDVLREAYFDYNLGQLPDEDGKLFARIGKQQVIVAGKSGRISPIGPYRSLRFSGAILSQFRRCADSAVDDKS